MDSIMSYVKPELIVVAVVLYIIGVGIKKMDVIKDKYIPCILGVLGILLCSIWVMASTSIGTVPEMLMALFRSIVQGVLVAGLSVYGNQLIKQIKSSE